MTKRKKKKKMHRVKVNKCKQGKLKVREVREKGLVGKAKKSFRKVISSIGKLFGISQSPF